MTNFKPGDRVKITTGMYEGYEATVEKSSGASVGVRFAHVANLYYYMPCELVILQPNEPEPTRPLVGPAPKVEGPLIQASFTYDEDTAIVEDAKGRSVLIVSLQHSDFGDIDDNEYHDFGRYVASALNARVFNEG